MVCEAVPGAKGAQRKRKVHQYTHTDRVLFIYVLSGGPWSGVVGSGFSWIVHSVVSGTSR